MKKNYFSSLLLAFAAILFIASCCNNKPATEREPLILSGHRGVPYLAPENTLASIDSAVRYGVEFAECDVCQSADGVFYILHDYTLDRTTNGTGEIPDLTSDYIDTLDAGVWFGEAHAGLRVPRFEDVLRHAKQGGLSITIDYRNGDLQELYDLIKREGMVENCSFTMPQEEVYFAFRAIDPEALVMQAYVGGESSLEADIEKWQPNVAVLWMDSITQGVVDRLHEKQIKVLALSLKGDDPDTVGYNKAMRLGVDIIATDRPDYYAKQR